MKKNIFILTALALSVLLVAGAATWLFTKPIAKNDQAVQENTSTNTTEESPLVLDKLKLPSGWRVVSKLEHAINLANDSNGCFISTLTTTDTAESNSPDTDQVAQTIEGITTKGNTVTQRDSELTITTSEATQTIKTPLLTVTSENSQVMYQKYGYVVSDKSYNMAQVSCLVESDLPEAESALLAIRFSRL